MSCRSRSLRKRLQAAYNQRDASTLPSMMFFAYESILCFSSSRSLSFCSASESTGVSKSRPSHFCVVCGRGTIGCNPLKTYPPTHIIKIFTINSCGCMRERWGIYVEFLVICGRDTAILLIESFH